jgi:uncharacterized membrane protein
MNKMIKIILISFALLSTQAYALSMGSLAKGDFASVGADESAKFTVLLWNQEKEYNVTLSPSSVPDGWSVIIDPGDVALGPSTGSEYIKLPYNTEAIRATSVSVIVKPSYSSENGNYTVAIKATTSSSTQDIGFAQERLFRFTVEYKNLMAFENKENSSVSPMVSTAPQSMESGPVSTNRDNTMYAAYAGMAALVLLISLLIYKYS